jgi:aspartate/tyrosine/aromatic aminotransferase
LFESLELLPPDAIIGLIAEYRNDPREPKVDLGIGVYRNASGETPVLDVVKRAEQRLVDTRSG